MSRTRHATFPRHFPVPVLWRDIQGTEVTTAMMDGAWIPDAGIEGCAFHFDLQPDGVGVDVWVCADASECFRGQRVNFDELAARALEAFEDRLIVDIVAADDLDLHPVADTPIDPPLARGTPGL
jgi:hypothetical protein